MRFLARHLLPGLLLIAAASGALLLRDLDARHRDQGGPRVVYTREHPARLAILQLSSTAVMDDAARGLLDALASRGYTEGERLAVRNYNPQGDVPTVRLMAQQIVGGGFDLAASISTVCLQALAKADTHGEVPFVFCAVSSPVAADVGVQALDTLDKPAHFTGYGTAQPVEAIFREALAANPRLKTVGVVWNPAEANSVVCTARARVICRELGLTLVEAPIEGPADVRTAADSLVARGAEAFWTGGDASMIQAYKILQDAADRARIPVFSNISGDVRQGALFDYGANYYQVGYHTGLLAADILDGRAPAHIPVRDLVPGRLGLNEQNRASLRDTWTFTPSQQERAGLLVARDGAVRELQAAAVPVAAPRPVVPPPGGRLPWRAQVILYIETAPCEETLHGLTDGLKEHGLVEGRDYVLKVASAQGELPVLPALYDRAHSDGTDLYLTLSTPSLQTAVRKVTRQPIVFSFSSDGVAAGAGKSDTDHLPNVTGVNTLAPYEDMVKLIKAYFPQWKRLGTVYCPVEVNSALSLKVFQEVAAQAGLTVEAEAANTISELPDAALSLASRNLDAIVQIPDNLSAAGFGAIARAARTRRVPLFAFQSAMVEQGAILALSTDYRQAGLDAAAKAARVMRGESPAGMPFSRPSKAVLALNLTAAREWNVLLPSELQQKADKVVP